MFSTVAHNCHGKNKIPHGKTKDLKAKPNTSHQKQNTSRQEQLLHSERKYLTTKANTSRQKQKPMANVKTSRQKQIHVLYLSLEEGSLKPKVLAKDVQPGCKSSMAAFNE